MKTLLLGSIISLISLNSYATDMERLNKLLEANMAEEEEVVVVPDITQCIFSSESAAQSYFWAMNGSTVQASYLTKADLDQTEDCNKGVLELTKDNTNAGTSVDGAINGMLSKEQKSAKLVQESLLLSTQNMNWSLMALDMYKQLRDVVWIDTEAKVLTCNNGFAFRALIAVFEGDRTYHAAEVTAALSVSNLKELNTFLEIL